MKLFKDGYLSRFLRQIKNSEGKSHKDTHLHTHVFQVQLDETDSYKERPPIKIVIVRAEGTLPVSLSAAVHANNDKDQYSNHKKRDSHTQTHNEFIGFCKRQDII